MFTGKQKSSDDRGTLLVISRTRTLRQPLQLPATPAQGPAELEGAGLGELPKLPWL